MGDVFLDTLKILPFLLVMNFVIEIIEYKSKGLKADKILKGGCAPLIGTAVGVVPQCGFSVVATELYAQRRIALGTLLAVYTATSDEAFLIMLSSHDGVIKILPVLIIKVCFALIVGYTAFAIEKILSKRRGEAGANADAAASVDVSQEQSDGHLSHTDGAHPETCNADGVAVAGECEKELDAHAEVHIHGCHHHSISEQSALGSDATKKQKLAHFWNVYLKHPLLHTATVILFIFIVNAVFGVVVYYVDESRLAAFMQSTRYIQPFLTAAVGLIPNCASSVVITELYIVGGLDLGGAVAGLCMGAGIGYAVLLKHNRPIKNTALIIVVMYLLSVALGSVVTLCMSFIAV